MRAPRALAVLLALTMLTGTGVINAGAASANQCSAEDCPGGGDGGGGGGGGGGGTGGGTTYNPGPQVNIQNVDVPVLGYSGSLGDHSCNQIPHLFYVNNQPDYRIVPRGTPIALVGITSPGSVANFGLYTNASVLVKSHQTQPSGGNCVIDQGAEYVDTSDLAPGYYYLWGSYWSLTDYYNPEWYSYRPVAIHNRPIAIIEIV